MRRFTSHVVVLLALTQIFGVAGSATAAPEGTMTWGVHITLASRWLDPAETEGIITPFMVLYALHDALVKPMPAGINTPSLAESWTQSKDGLIYEFVLRKGVKFHNGDPVTAADVKFSFDRYRGAGAKLLKERVREVQIVDPGRVRFVLKEPWPDFMTFYGTSATGAGWIVPKAYVEKVGDDGFKKAPIGAGPVQVRELQPRRRAGDGGLRGLLAQDRRTSSGSSTAASRRRRRAPPPSRRARWTSPTCSPAPSPRTSSARRASSSSPRRNRRAPSGSTCPTSGTRSRRGTTGACARPRASPSIARRSTRPRRSASRSRRARSSRARWSSRASSSRIRTIPPKAKRLLAEAGYPSGFDAGDFYPVAALLLDGRGPGRVSGQRSGIRTRIRTMERAAMTTAWREKKLKNVIVGITGAGGNAATRLEAYVSKNGIYTVGRHARRRGPLPAPGARDST